MKITAIICGFIITIIISNVNSRRPCIPRNYGLDSIVCMCNYSYCDDLDPIKKQVNTVLLFESGKSGNRFKETQLKFGQINLMANQTLTLTLDRSKKGQKIIGFGGAMTDAAAINIKSLPFHLATNIIKDYFSVNGIEYSAVRIPIAGSDYSTRTYSYDDFDNDFELKHFALAKEDIDFKIPLLQVAQYLSPHKIKFFGSPWSPPAWLKTNDHLHNGGSIKDKPGEKYYQTLADYFVKFVNAYKSNGIDIWGQTIENEPGTFPYNSLQMTPEQQRDFIKLNLGPTLAKAGLGPDKFKVMIYDFNREDLVKFSSTVLRDKEAAKYVSGIAFHWYGNGNAPPQLLDTLAKEFPDHFLFNTEASVMDANRGHGDILHLGNWGSGEAYANDIITDLDHYTTGWVDWNMALDTHGEPVWAHTTCNSPIVVNASSMEYLKQPMFYALGHFSKFISPDSVKITLNKSVNQSGFEAVAFERLDNATVLVALNKNDEPIQMNIVDNGLGQLATNLPAKSIQSYIWWH